MNRDKVKNKILKKIEKGEITPDHAFLRKMGKLESQKLRNDYLTQKMKKIKKINSLAEGGKILIIVGGCDCDGSQYFGECHFLNANFVTVSKFESDQADWADGSIYFEYDKPSNSGDYSYSSRDLALEAFENGHNHIIYR